MIRWFSKLRTEQEVRPKLTPDSSAAEALEQKLGAIRYQPTRGFLKDRPLARKATRANREKMRLVTGG